MRAKLEVLLFQDRSDKLKKNKTKMISIFNIQDKHEDNRKY